MYEDKTLVCKDCGNDFIFTAGEQEFYAEKGFENEPLRCPDCRKARKESFKNSKKMDTVVCSNCGGEAVVPFEPKGDRPVLCSKCFEESKNQ